MRGAATCSHVIPTLCSIMFRWLCSACLLLLVASSCVEHETTLANVPGGGVILTFDDHYVSDWLAIDAKLQQFDWKATFFVSNHADLDADGIDGLQTLHAHGHEIAAHSVEHLNAKDFTTMHSVREYVAQEVMPSIDVLAEQGFPVNAFAYPYGARTAKLDAGLLDYVPILRGTTYEKGPPAWNKNFANGSRVVYGLSLDSSSHNDLDFILRELKYARDHDKIVIFYAHQVSDAAKLPEYTTSSTLLMALCDYVTENNMHFMTMSDLLMAQPSI
jgi:peptidoglycan/xylan/chitin deacetylase (PgdA/CDA1 family)